MGSNYHTLSFCFLDDLCPKISLEWDFKNMEEIPSILENLWNRFLDGNHPNPLSDPSGYYFESETRKDDIQVVLDCLKKQGYYRCNRFEKYYVIAFSIDRRRFRIWSKDCDPEIIDWSFGKTQGPVVDSEPPEDCNENPVLTLMKNLQMQ